MNVDDMDFTKFDLESEEAPNNDLGIKITKDTMIMELLQLHPFAQEILMTYGMSCIGCAISYTETIGQAAVAHGVDLSCLLEDLNTDFSMFEYDEMDEYSGYVENSDRYNGSL